ncbi:sulfite reductase subunit alpha [Edaphobacter acidisoli]|uniref:assimilatory sulfite reductase (NADPH) n=1 Tax=Edaphobacter acidisoli TaxID=2040573 RepID=A0A916W2C4_9BACT|nr:flavodoxin domain-containing protein [Edaphobacter acidisoli]GGA61350.1 sulfite reductase subunit alpha [Edaphobacter acidisoli]
MATAPFIPETAPFTPDQRAWLNGFLAGIFAEPAAATQPEVVSLNIAVLYASQSGTGEGLARKVMKELKAKGHTVALASLDSYTPTALAKDEYAIIIASTYGEGEPPESVRPFYDQLCLETAPRLDKLSYTVLALGDKTYEQFCKFGVDLDERLQTLGANRMSHRVDCDVDLDEAFATWKTSFISRLDEIAGSDKSRSAATMATVITMPSTNAATPAQTHTRDNPFRAPLVEKKMLTKDVSSKLTLHMALSIADSKVHYEAGDACGVIPQNDPGLVAQILDGLKFSGDEQVEVAKVGAISLYNALIDSLQVTRLSRKLVQAYAAMGNCQHLLDLLVPEQQAHFDKYIYDRGVIDLLTEYPGVITDPSDLVAMLPRLTPRLYSISSSPLAHAGEVHTTVAVVRYRSHNMERGGVCSTMFADRTSIGDALPIYIQPNKKFRLPQDTDTPIIMIGPGTGIAPFRAFLHERRALGSKGRNWLFFGERSAKTDFLYKSEIEEMLAGKHLTLLDTAFSRDQEHKIYVQDRMLEQASAFWHWLQDGASIYVCGDASRMAKDVDAALHTIAERQGHLDHEAARDYVLRLKEENRYHRDVY